MRILIFGAAGSVGTRVVAEAMARGHEITAAVRNPPRARPLPAEAVMRRGDASNSDTVAELGREHDLVISATRPRPGHEHELVKTARALLDGVARAGTRLLLIGGAATLRLPGRNGLTLMHAPDFPRELLPIARACAAQLKVCHADTQANWTYLSPPAQLEPGERTGRYRHGTDELIATDDSTSTISFDDFAVALLDEAERPRHQRQRFTVGY